MSKSISTPNFDKVAQSMAVLLLFLIWENRHPPYWNYTSGFDFTYWLSWVFCTDAPNVKFLTLTVPKIWRMSQNFKS